MLDVIAFQAKSAALLDAADYDRWMEDFDEDCLYQVLSVENLDLGYDLPLLLAKNKNMLRDRILSLREANIYNIHRDRHVLSLPVVTREGDLIKAVTSLVIYQSDQEGISTLFAVGRYEDEIRESPQGLRLKRRDVILDTYGIVRLLSTPL